MWLVVPRLEAFGALFRQVGVEVGTRPGMFADPIFVGNVDFAFGPAAEEGWLGGDCGGGLGVVDGGGAEPGDVPVAVVGFPFFREDISGVGQVAFDDVGVIAGLFLPVVIDDAFPANYDLGPVLLEDTAGSNESDCASAVGGRHQVPLNHVQFLCVRSQNLVQHGVVTEEEVRVPETEGAGGFGGEHVQTGAAVEDGECATAVFAAAEEVAVRVDFGFAGGVGIGEEGFVVEDLLGVSFCIKDDCADGSGMSISLLVRGDVPSRTLTGASSSSRFYNNILVISGVPMAGEKEGV